MDYVHCNNKRRKYVVHTIVNTFTAKNFIEPLLLHLPQHKYMSEIIVDDFGGERNFLDKLKTKYIDKRLSLTLNPFVFITRVFCLIKYFRLHRPDVVHAHFTTGAVIPLIAARLSNVPIRIYHNHGVPYIGHKGIIKFALKLIEFINCALATQVITVSEGMISPLKNVTNKHIQLFGKGSACGLPDFYYQKSIITDRAIVPPSVNSSSFVFLYVGRPFKRKGFNLIINAFTSAFPDDSVNVHLLLAGCNDVDLKRVTKNKNKNIHALGMVIDMKTIYESSDVVVLPSYHEGFGYALLEGAASQCALISSDIPGPDSIVIPGVTGDVFPVGDSESLKNLLQEFYSKPNEVRFFGEKAYEESLNYKQHLIVSHYLDYMDNIFNAH